MAELFAAFSDKRMRASGDEYEEPIRAEIFSVEHLKQYAATLAAAHIVAAGPRRGRLLLPRLKENGRRLVAAYRGLVDAIRDEQLIW